jgi:hypothetical protein
MLDLDQADTVRQLAGEVGTERDVKADDSDVPPAPEPRLRA